MNKRILSLTLALVMILGTFTAVFADDVNHEEIAAEFLNDKGILVGDKESGDLMLDENLERRDSVVLLSRLLDEEEEAEVCKEEATWEDLGTDAYYQPFFGWGQSEGYFEGHDEKTFGPREDLTTQEYAVVLLRALKYDYSGAEDWKKVMDKAEKLGIMENTDVKANDKLPRGQMAIMTFNALSVKLNGKDVTLAEELGIELPEPEVLEVEEVYADNLKEIKIKLSKSADGDTVENLENYSVNNGVKIDKVTYDEDNNLVILEVEKRLTMNKDYELTIKNVKDEETTLNEKVTFKAIDNKAPEVVDVVGLGTRAVKVVMSEPIEGATVRDFKLDGKTVNGSASVNGREIFIRTYRDMEVGEHTLYIGQLVDFNKFKSEAVEVDFEIVEDKEAPEVVSHSAQTRKLVVEFDEDVDEATVAASSAYWMRNKDKKQATGYKMISGKRVEFYFDNDSVELPLNETVVYLDGIKDYSGNVMSKYELTVNPELDRETPEVMSAVVKKDTKDTIVVRFNKTVNMEDSGNGARNVKNYELKDSKGNKVEVYKVNSVAGYSDRVEVVLGVNLESGKTYTLTVGGIADTNRYPNYLYTEDFDISLDKSATLPEAVSAIFTKTTNGDQLITVLFNKEMDLATISNPENYIVKVDGRVRTLSEFSPYMYNKNSREVEIEIDKNLLPKDSDEKPIFVDEIRGTDLKDLDGERITNYGAKIEEASTKKAEPAKEVEVSEKRKIEVPFDEDLKTAKTAAVNLEGGEVSKVSVDGKKLVIELKKDLPTDLEGVTLNIVGEEITGMNGKPAVDGEVKLEDKIAPEATKVTVESLKDGEVNLKVTFSEKVTIKDYRTDDIKVYAVSKSGEKLNVEIDDLELEDVDSTKEVTLNGKIDLEKVEEDLEVRFVVEFASPNLIEDANDNKISTKEIKVDDFKLIEAPKTEDK